jgi:hypothetical protein
MSADAHATHTRRALSPLLPTAELLRLGSAAVSALERLHAKGFVHNNVSASALLLLDYSPGTTNPARRACTPRRSPRTPQAADCMQLCGLGKATRWQDPSTGAHAHYKQIPLDDSRNMNDALASANTLLGRVTTRRDDLEALAYTLLSLVKRLPWVAKYSVYEALHCIARDKVHLAAETICAGAPTALLALLRRVTALRFDEEPDYAALRALLAVPAAPAPIELVDAADAPPPLAAGETQGWLTVLNGHKIMTQRCHYDVAAEDVAALVAAAAAGGLRISAVACRTTKGGADGWALWQMRARASPTRCARFLRARSCPRTGSWSSGRRGTTSRA